MKILVIAGATASGKSKIAIELIKNTIPNGVIINCDAQQVYKEVPIITAQPDVVDLNEVPHMLYGHISITESYSVGEWLNEVTKAIKEVGDKGGAPILVGGSGMYINSLVNGISDIPAIDQNFRIQAAESIKNMDRDELYKMVCDIDPESTKKISPSDSQRLQRIYEIFLFTGEKLSDFHKKGRKTFFAREIFNCFHVMLDRELLYDKINKRFLQMIDMGVILEIKNLAKKYEDNLIPEDIALKAIGIREINQYIEGKASKEDIISKISQLMRNYAKRQLTWFRNQNNDFIITNSYKTINNN